MGLWVSDIGSFFLDEHLADFDALGNGVDAIGGEPGDLDRAVLGSVGAGGHEAAVARLADVHAQITSMRSVVVAFPGQIVTVLEILPISHAVTNPG